MAPSPAPRVTVITATTGDGRLADALASVSRQTFTNLEHLVFVDGQTRAAAFESVAARATPDERRQIVQLPYPVGTEGYNGHRMYAAGTYLARGEWLCFLDEDNFFDPEHIERLVDTVVRQSGARWAYSLRKIVDPDGRFLCNDDCESLGFWPSCLGGGDYLIDVNCYFLSRPVALAVSPLWFKKARSKTIEADRLICKTLIQHFRPAGALSRNYSVNYRVESTPKAVKRAFFLTGNDAMRRHYPGPLPWGPEPAPAGVTPQTGGA